MPDASPDIPAAAIPAVPAEIEGHPPSTAPPASPPGAARRPPRRRPDFSAAPIAGRDLTLILLQLALATILVWQFELEEQRHLLFAMLVVLGGFVVNVQLPPRLRHAWFLAVSLLGLVAVLGVMQPAGAPALASLERWSDVGLALSVAGSLIAAALLPIGFGPRVVLILALAALFTWLRSNSTAACWPVVGSMFMFRMISWLHVERKERSSRTWTETTGYFLMLPNVFFPLFPVVDAKVFRETWYNDDPRAIYQTGVHWITAGLLHLFLYRVIKYEVLPSPLAVRTPSEVLLYLAANYALYLRVSGHFHIICGMLHLFGWNLPRTHDHYFLAASFSEIWRRINIYWKDFLSKTFFFPAFFWLRGRLGGIRSGDSIAIAVAVVWVFGWTWLAHSWQTYWLIGLFPFHAADGVMWLAVGVLVAGNAVLDYRRARLPRKQVDPAAWGTAAVRSLKVMGMFLLVSLFWARWTHRETFRYVLHVVSSSAPTASEAAQFAGVTAGVFGVLTAGGVWLARRKLTDAAKSGMILDRQAGMNIAVMAILVVMTIPGGPIEMLDPTATGIRRLQMDRLAAGEALAVVDGYYEQLAVANSQGSPFLGGERKPGSQGDLFSSMLRSRNDLLGFELIPGWRGEFSGNRLTINRWGMRDRERTLEKPAGVVRIAIVGSSVVMGYGVGDDETMTRRVEEALNARADGPRFEVLNFGTGRSYAVHRRLMVEKKILAFDPDLIVYVAHQDELRVTGLIAGAIAAGRSLDDDCLNRCVENAGVKRGDPDGVIASRLNVETFAILRCTYDRLVRVCRERNIGLEYVYLPIPGKYEYPIDPKIVVEMAREAGMPTHDFSEWWLPADSAETVVPDTQHPTAEGQRRIAERLLQAISRAIDDAARSGAAVRVQSQAS